MASQTRVWSKSCELVRQVTQHYHNRKPLWWNKETQRAWTDKWATVTDRQKQTTPRSHDKGSDGGTDGSVWGSGQRGKRLAVEKFLWRSDRDTAPTRFWQFHQEMEGCTSNATIPDLVYENGAVLQTRKEKGSILLTRLNTRSSRVHRTICMKEKQPGKR